MKTLKLLQRNLLYILLTCVLCVGCSLPDQREVAESRANERYEIIVIDSCEYIFMSNNPMDGDMAITHKGNCKYCTERAKANAR